MTNLRATIIKMPLVGAIIRTVYRLTIALRYPLEIMGESFMWVLRSNEVTNFTYDLKSDNLRYLAAMVADVTGITYEKAWQFVCEVRSDARLKEHVAVATRESDRSSFADEELRLGRRIGWYVIARAIKPRVIVETGVDKGLGSCVLAAALRQNEIEGYPGKYYGTDINRNAGLLLTGEYAKYGRILYGDSIESLSNLDEKIDLFINDSDHSAEYEAREYRTVKDKLAESAIILGDNAHCTGKLLDFSLQEGRRFLYFQEKPVSHWYPGGGIGISFNR